MQLTRVHLLNYRAYPIAVLDMPANGVVLVAGANNSGKSALLSAFDAALRRQQFPSMGFGGEDWRIKLAFVTTNDERHEILNTMRSFNPDFSGHYLLDRIEVTVGLTPSGVGVTDVSFGPDLRSMSPAVRTDLATDSLMVTAPFAQGHGDSGDQWVRVQNRMDATAVFGGQGHPVRLMLKGLEELREGFFHVEALRQGAAATSSFNSTPALDPAGINLTAVLRHLNDNDRMTYNRVADTLENLVPELGRLGFRSAGTVDEVVLDDPLTPALRQNLQNLGTGVEQLLLTLIIGMAQPQARTVLIEEPETALESGAQRALLSLLQQWSNDRLFVVSTHSTAMLDWSSAANGQLYHVRRQGGRSTLHQIRSDFRGLLGDLGVRLSDVLSAETILVTEGTTDRDLLGIFMPELMATPTVAIVAGGGGNNARLAHIMQSWVSGSDALGSRQILFLRDRDELTPSQVETLEAKGSVRVLSRREIENYLLSASALHQVFVQEGLAGVDETAVAVALRAAADGTQSAVILGRVWWQLPQIRLADQSIRSALADQPDKLERLITVACDALMTREGLADRIRQLWDMAERDVLAEWPDRWSHLAPGANVLEKLYRQFLGRGYSKDRDGRQLARTVVAMDGVPTELRDLVSLVLGR